MRENDALLDAVADNLLDRLEDCRKAFPSALCMGGAAGAVRRLLRGRGELLDPLFLCCLPTYSEIYWSLRRDMSDGFKFRFSP
jgi:hypothetical protein